MAYPRKKRFSKSSSKKKNYKSSKKVVNTPGYTRTAGYYGANMGAIKPREVKFFDINANIAGGTIVDTPSIFNSVNLVVQGTGESGRIGRKIVVKNIDMKLWLQNGVDQLSEVTYRWIVFLDKQCNGAAATGADILTHVAAGEAILSQPNLQNHDRFVILHDKLFTINPDVVRTAALTPVTNTTSTVIGNSQCVKFSKRVNIPILFDNTAGGNITTVKSNNIGYLIVQRGSPQTTTTGHFNSRIRYIDS